MDRLSKIRKKLTSFINIFKELSFDTFTARIDGRIDGDTIDTIIQIVLAHLPL